LSIGGRILAFNVDTEFSGVVDGLVVVDLLKMSRKLLDRYLGRAGAEGFLRYAAILDADAPLQINTQTGR
jgi:hypothetical protein